MADVNWTDSTGKKRSGTAGARTWLTTDANGVARASVGKGKQRLHLNSGVWTEERTIEVTSEKPVEVEFHRAWTGERRITGRLMFDGEPYVPSPTLVARAWAPQPSPYSPPDIRALGSRPTERLKSSSMPSPFHCSSSIAINNEVALPNGFTATLMLR